MLKNAIKKIFWALGYDVVKRGTASRLVIGDALRRLNSEVGFPLVVDVGANRGQFRDYLRDEIGFRGYIVSLEPNHLDYLHCRERSKQDSKWDVHNLALGSGTGIMTLNVMRDSAFSSFLQPASRDFQFEGNLIAGTREVQVSTLDEFAVSKGYDLRGAYLKSDTQGFDLEVLRGARKTLPLLCGFQVELSVLPIYDGQPPLLSALEELFATGYLIGALSPVSCSYGAVIEYDCLMLNGSRSGLNALVDQ